VRELQGDDAKKTHVARAMAPCYNYLSMTNDELLEQLGKIIDAKLDEKLEPIKKNLATTSDIHN
jgi:hypothetical protein